MQAITLREFGIHDTALFSAEECKEIIAFVNARSDWQPALVHSGDAPTGPGVLRREMRRAEQISLNGSAVAEKFRARILAQIMPEANAHFHTELDNLTFFHVVRYAEGGEYRLHTDSGKYVQERKLTVLCYLNDDFGGGETIFPDFELTLKPRAGRVVTFPSNYRHAALPVASGVKYIMLVWVEDGSKKAA